MIYLKVAYLGLGGLIPNVVFGDNNQCHFVRSLGKEVFFYQLSLVSEFGGMIIFWKEKEYLVHPLWKNLSDSQMM